MTMFGGRPHPHKMPDSSVLTSPLFRRWAPPGTRSASAARCATRSWRTSASSRTRAAPSATSATPRWVTIHDNIIYTDQVIDIVCHVDHWVCAGESSWEGAVHVPEMPLPHRGRASQVPWRGEKIKIYMIEIISNISTAAVLLPVPLQLHGLRHRADEQRAGGEDAPRLHRAGAQRAVLPPLPRQDGHPHLRGLQETHRGGLVQSAEK